MRKPWLPTCLRVCLDKVYMGEDRIYIPESINPESLLSLKSHTRLKTREMSLINGGFLLSL